MPDAHQRGSQGPGRGATRAGGGGYQQGPRGGRPQGGDFRGGGGPPPRPEPTIDLTGVRLEQPAPDLFDGVAKRAAEKVAGNRHRNKPSQLRKFFDELVMWETRLAALQDERERSERFKEYLPFIRMLNAKAAYAEGRELIDENFRALLEHCLGQVQSPATLRNFKLFFEAFLGFYKAERPSDNR